METYVNQDMYKSRTNKDSQCSELVYVAEQFNVTVRYKSSSNPVWGGFFEARGSDLVEGSNVDTLDLQHRGKNVVLVNKNMDICPNSL